jgi:hypothetical protein
MVHDPAGRNTDPGLQNLNTLTELTPLRTLQKGMNSDDRTWNRRASSHLFSSQGSRFLCMRSSRSLKDSCYACHDTTQDLIKKFGILSLDLDNIIFEVRVTKQSSTQPAGPQAVRRPTSVFCYSSFTKYIFEKKKCGGMLTTDAIMLRLCLVKSNRTLDSYL